MYIPTGDEDTDEHDINADDIRLPSGACLSVCVSPAAKTLVVVTSHAWLVRRLARALIRVSSRAHPFLSRYHCAVVAAIHSGQSTDALQGGLPRRLIVARCVLRSRSSSACLGQGNIICRSTCSFACEAPTPHAATLLNCLLTVKTLPFVCRAEWPTCMICPKK
jgi:hypothetical protein